VAKLLVKYAENLLLLAEEIKRRLEKAVEWFGVNWYRKWLSTLVAWFFEDWPYAFASKIVIMTHNVEILQITWLCGTHLEGHTNVHLRIIESFRLEKTLKIIESNINLTLPSPPPNHVSNRHIYTSFKYLQGWWLNHFRGQPVPMLDSPFREQIFPNI